MNQDKKHVPRWLRRTQEGSWEPEILISGIVLLALTQVPRLLDNLHYRLEERTSTFYLYTSSIDDVIVSALKGCSYWLMAGLVLHLLLRSLWVSFVGLSFVFPDGVQSEKLKLKPWFEERIRALPKFEESVVKLENVCSTVYATAFLFAMATLGLCLYLLFCMLAALGAFLIFPIELFYDNLIIDRVLLVFTLIVALPYFIDFLTLGWLKRLPFFWRIYRYPYRFMSFITFAYAYRGIYYGLISNVKRWRVFAILMVFIAGNVLFIMPDDFVWRQAESFKSTAPGMATIDGYYRDQLPPRYSTWAHIQSERVGGGVLQVFLPHKTQYEESILKACERNLSAKGIEDEFENKEKRNLACLGAFYSFYIDDEEVKTDPLYYRELHRTRQFGLSTTIDIGHLERGHHLFKVFVNWSAGDSTLRAEIPFFYDRPLLQDTGIRDDLPEASAIEP